MVRALLTTLQAASAGHLAERLDRIFDSMREANQDPRIEEWLASLTRYLFSQADLERNPVEIGNALAKVVGEEKGMNMSLTTAEQLMLEGEIKGEIRGKIEGKIELLLTILKARFGSSAGELRGKIAARTETQLDSLGELAATCPDLETFKSALS